MPANRKVVANARCRWAWIVLAAQIVQATVGGASAFAQNAAAAAVAADLRVIKTKHYTLRTDLDGAFAADLATRLDAMYDEYDRRTADFKKPAGDERVSFDVYVFARRADYMTFTENRLPNSGGVFMPDKNQLAAFLGGDGRDGLRRTLQHEAFHQFAHRSISTSLPPWLNEGLAQLFEEGIWTGKSFLLNQVPPRRLRQLQADIKAKRLIAFEKFLPMTLDEWNTALAGDMGRGATQYNQAWAMVHFLVNAGTENGGKAKYRERLVQLLKETNAGTPADQAFRDAFGENVKGFQDRFADYALAMQPTTAAVMLERQNVLADLLKGLAAQNERFRDVAAFRTRAMGAGIQITYRMNEIEWKTDENVGVYFSGADNKPFGKDELYFEPRGGDAPLPDLVCRTGGKSQIRSRFFRAAAGSVTAGLGGKIEHEVLVETLK